MAEKIPFILSKVKELYLQGLSTATIFRDYKDQILAPEDINKGSAVALKSLVQRMKRGEESVNISKAEEASRIPPPKVGERQQAPNKAYTAKKLEYTDDLINEIDTLTKDPKNKTLKQVETKLYKKFNTPEYNTVPKSVDPQNVFFRKDTNSFSIPRDYELYGAPYGKKKVAENKVALRQIIGTKFFANNPNYEKVAGLLTAFYTAEDPEFTKKERETMRKFVKDFSITRSLKGDNQQIPGRFFKQLDFDFGRKLTEYGKIFNVTEYLNEQIKNPRISGTDKAFYRQELNSFLDNRKGILSKLSEKYPNLFKYKVSPSGNLQFEHRVARALGVQGVSLPKDYIARGSYVPGRFNQAKFFNYDKPLMELVSEYNTAKKSEKPNIKLKIENLTKDFNTRSGGFLEPVKFDFKNKVKITDTTPIASKVKDADLLLDIDKSIEQSNKYFQSFGDEKLFGMGKQKASSFVASGKEYSLFKKLVDTVKKSPESCRAILDYQTGGISKTCAVALETDPVGSAEKLKNLDAQSGPLAKVKNAALGFLKSPGIKRFTLAGVAGAGVQAIVKEFRNDDPTSYLSNEDQQKNMLVSMAMDPIAPDFERPDILDYQLPAVGATVAGATAISAPSTIKASRSRGLGVEQKGLARTAGRVLGRGLGVAASPGLLAPLAAMDITSQIAEGDSAADIASDPLNYLYPAFADQTPKLTRGLPSALRGIASLGMSPAALRLLSRAGILGFGASLGLQGMKLLQDD